jgi:hypothetical protein
MIPFSKASQVHEGLAREGVPIRSVRELADGGVELVFLPGVSAVDVARANQIAASWSPTSVVSSSREAVTSPLGGPPLGSPAVPSLRR